MTNPADMSLRDQAVMRQAAGESHPVPPYPPRDSWVLAWTIDNIIRQAEEEGLDLRTVVTSAVVTGWYEGHLHAVDGPAPESLRDAPTG